MTKISFKVQLTRLLRLLKIKATSLLEITPLILMMMTQRLINGLLFTSLTKLKTMTKVNFQKV